MTNDLEIIGGADVFSGNSHMLIFVKRYNNAALSTNYFWRYFWNWAYLCYKQKQSDREGCRMKKYRGICAGKPAMILPKQKNSRKRFTNSGYKRYRAWGRFQRNYNWQGNIS